MDCKQVIPFKQKQPPDSHLRPPQTCNFIKKETLAQVFSCEFCETSKNTFFTEHLWTIASFLNEIACFYFHFFKKVVAQA